MVGFYEGGNEPPGSLKVICKTLKILCILSNSDPRLTLQTLTPSAFLKHHGGLYVASHVAEQAEWITRAEAIARRVNRATWTLEKTLVCPGLLNLVVFAHTTPPKAFEMWIWRRMERVKWTDRIRNEAVLERVSEERMTQKTDQEEEQKLTGSLAEKKLPTEGYTGRNGEWEKSSG
ncbi:hypothetical protein ANN_15434 [Periplaneta americana]|uniref:Uncharacterized protein n=1 Tax=Periplaneta americana TaxID=6978 RepID=A0ABQ8SHP4_PERAM|nr:hypothetical protein ANN_15434 [Periplaneta americana]